MTPISSLTTQQKTLLWAKHEYPDAIDFNYIADDTYYVILGDGDYDLVNIGWNTAGPVWEREKHSYYKSRLVFHRDNAGFGEVFTPYHNADLDIRVLFMAGNIPESLAAALLEYWYPDGVDEEMLG